MARLGPRAAGRGRGTFFMSMSAAGMPTMLLRPTTTAFFPASATPLRSSSTTHPLGVHGMNSGSWPFMLSLPMFSGWKPSTSFSRLMAASTWHGVQGARGVAGVAVEV